MNLGSSFQIMALCKFGFLLSWFFTLSPWHKFCFGNGNIKDVRNVDSTVHMYVGESNENLNLFYLVIY